MSVCPAIKTIDVTRTPFFKQVMLAVNTNTRKLAVLNERQCRVKKGNSNESAASYLNGFHRQSLILALAQLFHLMRHTLKEAIPGDGHLPLFPWDFLTTQYIYHRFVTTCVLLGIDSGDDDKHKFIEDSCFASPRYPSFVRKIGGEDIVKMIVAYAGRDNALEQTCRWMFVRYDRFMYHHSLASANHGTLVDLAYFSKYNLSHFQFILNRPRDSPLGILNHAHIRPTFSGLTQPTTFRDLVLALPCKANWWCDKCSPSYTGEINMEFHYFGCLTILSFCKQGNPEQIRITPIGTSTLSLDFPQGAEIDAVISAGVRNIYVSGRQRLTFEDPDSIEFVQSQCLDNSFDPRKHPNLHTLIIYDHVPFAFGEVLDSIKFDKLTTLFIDPFDLAHNIDRFAANAPNISKLGIIPFDGHTGQPDDPNEVLDKFTNLKTVVFRISNVNKSNFLKVMNTGKSTTRKLMRILALKISIQDGILPSTECVINGMAASIKVERYDEWCSMMSYTVSIYDGRCFIASRGSSISITGDSVVRLKLPTGTHSAIEKKFQKPRISEFMFNGSKYYGFSGSFLNKKHNVSIWNDVTGKGEFEELRAYQHKQRDIEPPFHMSSFVPDDDKFDFGHTDLFDQQTMKLFESESRGYPGNNALSFEHFQRVRIENRRQNNDLLDPMTDQLV